MSHGLTNLMRREAERAMSRKASTLMGFVSAYDPSKYAAKVVLQPDGVETGFIPIGSPWVGNGFGFSAGPNIGDMVDVHFQEWGKGAPYVSLRFYGNKARAPGAPSGEMWMVHKSGASIKLKNDGTLVMTDGNGAVFTLDGDGTSSITGNHLTTTVPQWDVNGIMNATKYYAEGVATIPDGTYCTGLGLATNGYITTKGGLIVAIKEAS